MNNEQTKKKKNKKNKKIESHSTIHVYVYRNINNKINRNRNWILKW